MNRKLVFLVALAFAVMVMAGCSEKKGLGPLGGLTEKTPTPVSVVVAAPTQTSVAPAETPTTAPTKASGTSVPNPPGPTATAVPPTKPPCVPQAAFVMDITVPDGTEFKPGESFDKVWRLMNTGDCPWPDGTVLMFVSGDQLGAPKQVPVGAAAPGSTADVSVGMIAPQAPGTYKGTWRLVAPDGVTFGPEVYVKIVVAAPTSTPSPTSTPTPAPTPTKTCATNPDPRFDQVLAKASAVGMNLGCPQDGVVQVQGAFQRFWSDVENPNPHMHLFGMMIWVKSTKKIYAMSRFSETQRFGSFEVYDDLWHEGLPQVPPACAGMTPPQGYQLPIRGFGKVWCDYHLLDVIGWPDQKEEAVILHIQVMDNGALIETSNGYKIALDLTSHRWTFTH